MKLLRYGLPGREKPGLLDAQGRIRDLSSIIDDVADNALLPDLIETPWDSPEESQEAENLEGAVEMEAIEEHAAEEHAAEAHH